MASPFMFSNPVLAFLLLLLLSSFLYMSLAASGGSMGGSSSSGGSGSSFSSGGGYSSSSSTGGSYSSWNYIDSGSGQGGERGGGVRGGSKEDRTLALVAVGVMVILLAGLAIAFCCSEHRPKKESEQYRREPRPIKSQQYYTLIMVQVALMGNALYVQKELNEIARTTNTATASGWHYILKKTVSVLLRNPEYLISGFSSVEKHYSSGAVDRRFKQLSTAERDKFDIESLVNVNNVKIQREVVPQANKLGKDYLVVTILVAANGVHKVPVIRSTEEIIGALRSLNVNAHELQALEVLWTPQAENDTLSEQEFLQNYPHLKPGSMT